MSKQEQEEEGQDRGAFHFYNLTVKRELWVKFVRTIPREISVQRWLNGMIEAHVREASNKPGRK